MLRRYLLLSQKIIDDSILSGKPFSLEEFKRKLIGKQTTSTNFIDFAKELIGEMQQAGKTGNSRVYNNVSNSLKNLQEGKLPLKILM